MSRYNRDVICNSCRHEVRRVEFEIVNRFEERFEDEEPRLATIQIFLTEHLPHLQLNCGFVPYRRDEVAQFLPIPDRESIAALDDMVEAGTIEDYRDERGKRIGIKLVWPHFGN